VDSSFSPQDLDAWARTAAAEDANNPLAVAAVIGNRLAAGGYGSTPAAVVHAPKQFEVWQNGRAQAVDPASPAYQNALQAVQAIASGQADDPTRGATHFYSPSGQRSLGRNSPSWAQGDPLASIGGQLFYAPNGPVVKKAVQRQQPAGPDVDGLMKLYGGDDAPASAATPSASAPAVGGPDVDALAKMYGADEPDAPAVVADRPMTVHPGTLANADDDGLGASIAKNVATGAVKGIGDAAGVVGNTSNLADYLVAKAESAATGKPVEDVLAGLAQNRQQEQGNPTIIGRIADAINPRNLFPSGSDVSNKLLAQTGEYVPTSEAEKMIQAGAQTVTGALGPGVRAPSAGVASSLSGALANAAGQAPMAAVSGALGQYGTDASGNPLVGLAAGAAPALALGAGGAAVNKLVGTVEPNTAALAQTARDKFNIPLGAGQVSESPAIRFADSVVNKLPLSGAAPARAAQQSAFNKAVAGTFGENAEKITPDVMAAAKTRLGGEFDRIAKQSTIIPDQQFQTDILKTVGDARQVLPDAEITPIVNQIKNVIEVAKKTAVRSLASLIKGSPARGRPWTGR
jgi:hypothetical protein